MKSGPHVRITCLLATIVVGLCAMSCGLRAPLPEGAELIPGDATFAVSVDVPAILDSNLYKTLRSNESYFGQNRANFYRFAEATGLDPTKDIQRVLFLARASEDGIAQMTGLVLLLSLMVFITFNDIARLLH